MVDMPKQFWLPLPPMESCLVLMPIQNQSCVRNSTCTSTAIESFLYGKILPRSPKVFACTRSAQFREFSLILAGRVHNLKSGGEGSPSKRMSRWICVLVVICNPVQPLHSSSRL